LTAKRGRRRKEGMEWREASSSDLWVMIVGEEVLSPRRETASYHARAEHHLGCGEDG
jgi:hypothetical protein